MTDHDYKTGASGKPREELPFVAPCRQLTFNAPFRWIKLGWQDFKHAPRQSISYGVMMVVSSYGITLLALKYGNLYSLLSLLSGFILLGPIVAIGLYSISSQLQEGKIPILGHCLREGRRQLGNLMVLGFILLVVFLIWARSASMLHIFYPVESGAKIDKFVLFFSIGTGVGAVFSAIIFIISAFSLPMIMDRKVDMVTAVITSANAVLRNKLAMLVWSLLIVLSVLLSFATAYLGFLVLLPVIGHATWHAYQETIDVSKWPKDE